VQYYEIMRWRPGYFVLTEGQNILLFPLKPCARHGPSDIKGKNYGIGSQRSISVYERQKESRIFFTLRPAVSSTTASSRSDDVRTIQVLELLSSFRALLILLIIDTAHISTPL
jgi:hypothetical protein